ncbi:aconitate hydratase, mitochondrial [Cryptococcus deuterogattii 2001/935-1]|nr:aconitate hydratase, mitochondrial [Cryptococcus deuterogattii 2001/935-1]
MTRGLKSTSLSLSPTSTVPSLLTLPLPSPSLPMRLRGTLGLKSSRSVSLALAPTLLTRTCLDLPTLLERPLPTVLPPSPSSPLPPVPSRSELPLLETVWSKTLKRLVVSFLPTLVALVSVNGTGEMSRRARPTLSSPPTTETSLVETMPTPLPMPLLRPLTLSLP